MSEVPPSKCRLFHARNSMYGLKFVSVAPSSETPTLARPSSFASVLGPDTCAPPIGARTGCSDRDPIRIFRLGPDPHFPIGTRSVFSDRDQIQIARQGPDPDFPIVGEICIVRQGPDPHFPIGLRLMISGYVTAYYITPS